MADIKCAVVKDLIPLYVDDVVSEDSKIMIEKHMKGCKECSDYYRKLKESDNNYEKTQGLKDKEALKKIKKSIVKKRLITALITAICVAAIAGGTIYEIFIHEKYIPYEETGLYVSDEAVRSDRVYYKSSGIYTPNGETLFLYLTTTTYTELSGKKSLETGFPIIDLTDEGLTFIEIDDDNNEITEMKCREIYYIPEEKAKQFMKLPKWSDTNADKEIEDLKAASVLIWSNK